MVYGHVVSTKIETMAKILGQRIATEVAVASTAAAGTIESLPDGKEEIVFETLTEALKYVWILYTTVAGAGLLIGLSLKDLRFGDADAHADRPVEEEGQVRSWSWGEGSIGITI